MKGWGGEARLRGRRRKDERAGEGVHEGMEGLRVNEREDD